MNLFDCDRQRSYFERTNQRLQKKILFDIEKQKIEQIQRIQVRFFIFNYFKSTYLL
jgi:adenine-specific DNA methylase